MAVGMNTSACLRVLYRLEDHQAPGVLEFLQDRWRKAYSSSTPCNRRFSRRPVRRQFSKFNRCRAPALNRSILNTASVSNCRATRTGAIGCSGS